MYRKIVLITLCLSFAVTACNDGGKKRVPLKKGKGGPVDAKASEGVKGMNKVLSDTACLRIDSYFSNLEKQKEETLFVYTSDVNVGSLEAVGGKDVKLLAEQDQKVRATVAIKNGSDPLAVSTAAKDIYNSSETVQGFYVTAMDPKCETAAIRGAGGNFTVVKKSADELLLVNKGQVEKSIRYNYDRRSGKMKITTINPLASSVCGKGNRVLEQTYIIARDQDTQKAELENGFAKLIVEHTEEPSELTSALGTSTGRVSIPANTLARIKEIIFNSSTAQPTCP